MFFIRGPKHYRDEAHRLGKHDPTDSFETAKQLIMNSTTCRYLSFFCSTSWASFRRFSILYRRTILFGGFSRPSRFSMRGFSYLLGIPKWPSSPLFLRTHGTDGKSVPWRNKLSWWLTIFLFIVPAFFWKIIRSDVIPAHFVFLGIS